MPAATTLVQSYLDTLTGAGPATVRQRRWALDDLLTYTQAVLGRPPSAAELLTENNLTGWLSHAADPAGAGASHAGQRARASAARALATYATLHALTTTVPTRALRLPPTPPAGAHPDRARRLLAAAGDGPPFAVPFAVWARFCAHTHLLAATGAPERHLAALSVTDVAAHATAVRTPAGWVDLPDLTRHVTTRWLEVRAALVASLQGSDPGGLWLRVHPGVDRRTKVIAPAGLPISARGLRLSFTTTVAALGAEDPAVGQVSIRDVRALGRTDDIVLPRPPADAAVR